MNTKTDERWLRWSLSAIVVLLAVIAVELWDRPGTPYEPSVYGQMLPDSGLQRKQILQSQERSVSLLEQILAEIRIQNNQSQRQTQNTLNQILRVLQKQTIKVAVMGTDKESKESVAPKVRLQPKE